MIDNSERVRQIERVSHSNFQVPRWLVRHFEYAVQLSADFANELKLKKIIELRRTQRGTLIIFVISSDGLSTAQLRDPSVF